MWDDSSLSGRIACAVYSKGAFPLFRKVLGPNPLVVYYHIVSNQDVPHVKNLYIFRNTSEFTRDIEVLLKFFHPLSLQDLLLALNGKRTLERNSFLLTFDDGLKECYEVIAPILKSCDIPATFFVCSAFVDNKELAYDHKKSLLSGLIGTNRLSRTQEAETRVKLEQVGINEPNLVAGLLRIDYGRRQLLDEIAAVLEYDFAAYLKGTQPYLTSGQIAELVKMGHAIGAHSIDHPRYADLSIEDQLHQTRESVRFVKDRFALGYGAFSFPHSDAEVSHEFFRETFATGEVDVSFGNQGLLNDTVRRNIQRSSMEKTMLPAEAILGKSLARRFVKAAGGRLVVKRI